MTTQNAQRALIPAMGVAPLSVVRQYIEHQQRPL